MRKTASIGSDASVASAGATSAVDWMRGASTSIPNVAAVARIRRSKASVTLG